MKNDKYVQAINEIEPDEAAKSRMLGKVLNYQHSNESEKEQSYTMTKQNYRALPRLAYAVCAIVLIAGLSAGVAFADNIRSFIGTVLSFDDGTKYAISDIITVDINDTAIKDSNVPMTVSEAEQMLGVDILTSDKATTYLLGYTPRMAKNGNIARVDLWYAGFIDYSDETKLIDETDTSAMENDDYQTLMAQRKYIAMSISFLTRYAEEGHISAFEEGIDATGGKRVENRYELDNLGVEAAIYTSDWSDTRLTAAFVYDGMLYTVIGNNVPKDEMLDILQSLK